MKGMGKTASIIFGPGSKTAILPIPIESDDQQDDQGTITVTLIAESQGSITYTVAAAPDNEAMVMVFDDDGPPVLSIEEDSGMVAENAGPAQFMLIARGLTATETIMIKATPAEDGHDFLTDMIAGTEDPKDVVFTDPDGDNIYTGLFPVTLDDDEDGEATGTIKLTLGANTGVYILTSDNEGCDYCSRR